MRKHILPSVILYFLFVFVVIGNISGQEKKVTYTVYSNAAEMFSLKVPAGWLPANQKSKVVIYIIVETSKNVPIHSFNIQKIPVNFSGEESPLAAIDLVAQQFYDQLSGAEDFKLIKDRYLSVKDREIRETIFSLKYGKATLMQAQTFIYNKNAVYVLVYTADKTVYNEEIHKTALNSFSFR
ncbi:MAG: hypothetical protein GXP33_05780 [Spirochaetes bacterium]|nr:hypothetical protein [Spirochaetota bacterium]